MFAFFGSPLRYHLYDYTLNYPIVSLERKVHAVKATSLIIVLHKNSIKQYLLHKYPIILYVHIFRDITAIYLAVLHPHIDEYIPPPSSAI